MHPRVCPCCQKALPQNYQGRYCINCGTVFAIAAASLRAKFGNSLATSVSHPVSHKSSNGWILFAGILILLLSQFIFMACIH